MWWLMRLFIYVFSSRRRHTRCALVTGVQTCALPIYSGQIVTNLFEEDGYFADSDAFWAAQQTEIEKRKAAYLEDGWSAVEIVPTHSHFSTWEHEKIGRAPCRERVRHYE